MKLRDYFKNLINTIYKVNDVQQGYYFWIAKLVDISMDLFEYEGLPKTLPSEEIERRLILTGHCGILNHPTLGIIACDSNPYNYNIYGRFKNVDFFNPSREFIAPGFFPGNKTIDKDCIMLYNNSIEKYLNQPLQGTDNFFQLICRYARILADIDATTNILIINTRAPYLPIASNEQTRTSVLEVFNALKRGEQKVILDSDFLKDLKTLQNQGQTTGLLKEYIDAQNSIINNFLYEIGIYNIEKKERLINAELQQENKNKKVFIYSMLRAREHGIRELNDFFGLKVSVKLRESLYDDSELYEEGDGVE